MGAATEGGWVLEGERVGGYSLRQCCAGAVGGEGGTVERERERELSGEGVVIWRERVCCRCGGG